MKTIKVFILLSLSAIGTAFAQDTIFISADKITAVAFPRFIEAAVTADKEIITSIKADSILTLKAASKLLPESTLQVRTSDGTTWVFPVNYSYGRAGRSILAKNANRITLKETGVNAGSVEKPVTILSREMAGAKKLKRIVKADRGSVAADMSRTYIADHTFFWRLRLANDSSIPYDIDFIRFYIRDLEKAKRTVTQEQEIYPECTYGKEISTISPDSKAVKVFTFNKFTLPKDKAMFVEIYETNGNRHLVLKVKDSDIQNAATLNKQQIK